MSCSLNLIVLGIGYIVLLKANRETKGLRLLGLLVGVLMMVGAVGSAICAAKCAGGAPMCPVSYKK